jgi:hypothetical protein
MATAIIPPKAQLSEEAEFRNTMYADALSRLQHIAYRSLHVHNLENDQFDMILLCATMHEVQFR